MSELSEIYVSRLEESSSGMGKKCWIVLFAECSVSALSMPLEIDMSVYTEAFKHAWRLVLVVTALWSVAYYAICIVVYISQ